MSKGLYYVKGGFIVVKAGAYGLLGIAATGVGTVFNIIKEGCLIGLDHCKKQMDDLNNDVVNGR